MKDSQDIPVSFEAFVTMLLRSPFFWAVTKCHIREEWRPQLIPHKTVKEAAVKSLVIVLVSLLVMLWDWTAQLV